MQTAAHSRSRTWPTALHVVDPDRTRSLRVCGYMLGSLVKIRLDRGGSSPFVVSSPAVEPDTDTSASWLTQKGLLRVPEITAVFWIIKGLSTAMGESTSDFLVHAMAPELAVVLGFVGFVLALALQFHQRRYVAWAYWLAVVMVGIFGTMSADVLHVGFHVPYTASTILYAIVLAAIFVIWQRTEHTLSIHSIDTVRRETFYWATVAATFAMGTALGDFTASTLHLGYFSSAMIFAALIA